MESRPLLRNATAIVACLCAVATGLGAVGFAMGDVAWVPAWGVVTALYVAIAVGLFARRTWAPALAQGAALFGVLSFVQAGIALQSAMPAIAVGLGLHVALGGLSLFVPDAISPRQRWSLRFAAAGLVPAALFALAPEQTGAAMIAVLGGASLVFLGTLGLARGRTWGVLVALVGVPALALGVALAPALSFSMTHHFLVAEPLAPMMLDVLGTSAAACALLAVFPFVGPIARFVFRGASA